jgi:ligand-binding sensor domain-containing protein/signal transduction histidine kinase
VPSSLHQFLALIGVCALAVASPSFADSDYLVDVWGTEEGLPNNTVSGIAQTRDGYLWCATYDGVVRFDGARFVRIGPDDSTNQAANRVQCLLVDRRGQLWLGTDGAGAMRYAEGKFTAVAEEPDSAFNSVRCLAEDRAGDLWLGTRGGVGRLKNGVVAWFTDGQGFTNSAKSTWNFAFDSRGDLWAADWNSLKVFRTNTFEVALQRPEVNVPIRAVYVDPAGDIWAGMMGQALRHSRAERWESGDAQGQFTASEVTAFLRTRAGEFWAGTRKGLYRERSGNWESFTIGDGLASSEVRVLFEDQEGNLWVGTGTTGLARLKRRVVNTYAAHDGLTDGPVFALLEKADGDLMIGLSDGRLVEGRPGKFRPVKGLAGDAPIKSILKTRDGALLIGTFGNGLLRVHDDKTTLCRPTIGSPARTDKVSALLEDRGGTAWVGTFYGLYKLTQPDLLAPVLKDGRELRVRVTALAEDHAGGIWAACDGLGVLRIFQDKQSWLTRADGLPTHFIRALYPEPNGALWIGTAAGLCRWREGTLMTLTKAHGLIDETISQIIADDAGTFWLGSNAGLMRVARDELHAVTEGAKATLESSVFGRAEGMLSAECSGGFSPAGVQTRDGKLWFPTAKGLVMIEPSQLKRAMRSAPPPVYIEEVRADGKLVFRPHTSRPVERSEPPRAVVLPHNTRRLEFVYTALSLAAPERVRFRHRLEGFDSDWTEAGAARTATYANLTPGRYRFRVIAANNDGVWNQAGHAVSFRIAAPFWATWWFLSAAGISLAGLLAASVRFASVRHLRRKLDRLEQAHAIEKERMRIAQDMHDELGGKLSRISFLSDLTQRTLPPNSEATQQVEEVSEAAREVIRTVDEIVWAVSPRNDTLESLVHYISRYAEEFFELTPIELELVLPPEFPAHRLSADVRHNLFCAVKEGLTNVLKHAEAKRVRIEFFVERAAFRTVIQDDGEGFETEAALASGTHAVARRGNGLLNIRERMAAVGGGCLIESAPEQGTRAEFSVPLR